MKEFNKKERARHAELLIELQKARYELESEIESFNAKLAENFAPVEQARDNYNEKLAECRGFIEDKKNEAQDYFDDKSEKWQEGDKGSTYSDWISALEWEPDDVEVNMPEEIPEADVNAVTEFEELPLSVED